MMAEYTAKELDRLVVFTGDAPQIPSDAYRRATVNESRQRGVGIGFKVVTDAVLLHFENFYRHQMDLQNYYRPRQDVRRDIARFLDLVIRPNLDCNRARRAARRNAVRKHLAGTEFARYFGRNNNDTFSLRRACVNIKNDVEERAIDGDALQRLANYLSIPTTIPIQRICQDLVENYNN